MKLSTIGPPADLPAADARIPGYVVSATLVCVGLALTLVDYGVTGWLAIGIALALGAALAPTLLAAWALILFLALGQLAHHEGLHWQFLVLLAGVHLLHVLAMYSMEVPKRGWVQPRVFVAPFLRYLVIEVPTQAVAIIALVLLAPNSHGHRPVTIAGFAVVGTVALAALVLVLMRSRSAEA